MKPETFFDNFETLAEAPNGVKKLRELILELAVRGKLMTQGMNDEPTSVLLEKIKSERERLFEEKKINKNEVSLPIKPKEIPFDLPSKWAWVTLGELGITQTGTTPKKGDNASYGKDYPFVKPADILPNWVEYNKERLSKEGVRKYGRLASSGSILMVCIGSIGKGNIIERDCSFNQQINSLTPYSCLNPYLINYFLRSGYFQNEAWARSSRTTLAILNKGKWEKIPIPLPPFEEQARIVAKIDQLMSLCDELEARQQKKCESRAHLNSAALDRLLAARATGEFAEGWRRISENFDLLYDAPENVGALRQAILQLAVMGKLVAQDENDEPASVLLEKIKTYKEKLIKEQKFIKSKPLPPINPNEVAYELPTNWIWTKIGHLCISIVPNRDKPKSFSGGIPWITLPDFDNKKIEINIESSGIGLSESEVKEYNARIIPSGNVIMSCIGRFGLVAVIDTDIVVNQQIHGFVVPAGLDSRYLAYTIKAQKQLMEASATSTTILYLNKTRCESIPLPLPPLEEQRRIVARVDQLMSLCDELEAGLLRSQADSEKLVVAVIGEMV